MDQVGPLNTVFNYSPTGQAPQGSTITIYVGFPTSEPGEALRSRWPPAR